MRERPLHIAWLGGGPRSKETGGAPGVASDLLAGLAALGHRIDCIFAGDPHELPERLEQAPNLSFVWSANPWRWGGWYNRTRVGPFVTGLAARALVSLRLRREVTRRHRADPYDLVFQFNNIEALSLPASVRRQVPLVIDAGVHMRGELRFLIKEWRLALRTQPAYVLAVAIVVTWVRALVQRALIGRAELVICISAGLRDQLVSDYRVRPERTVVVPNPVRVSRFAQADLERAPQRPPAILVLGRVAVRKGIEDVIAVARLLHERGTAAQLSVIGRASLWSNYIPLLSELPGNAEFVGALPPDEVPAELARTDVLLQPSRYEPFGLTVGEALASGALVVGSTAVGALEGVDQSVAAALPAGDAAGMADAIEELLERLESEGRELRARARAEAERLWAPELVCERIDAALQTVVNTFGRR
jgi:glycosyltransferase involved in cell wall biosynthesis